MQIYPSILETNVEIFWQQLKKLSPYFSYFQIDIADGKLVPNKTIQINDIISTIGQLNNLAIEQLIVEFHLMVFDYESEINKIDKLNRTVNFVKVKKVLIHLKALKTIAQLLHGSIVKKAIEQLNNLTMKQFNIDLVLNPEDEVKSNWSTIKNFPTVQIMSVNPGFQGTPFLPETLNKINELRKLGFKGTISLDGAINDKTFPIILKNKYLPDVLFPGSYLKEYTKKRLQILIQLLKKR
jgi:pentose-5-phosphate-3-epimerase